MPRVKELTRDGLTYRIRFRSWLPRLGGHTCITLGSTIHTRQNFITERTHAHEHAHVLQWARYGVLGFIARYLWGLLTHSYQGHPMKVEAHRYADRTVGTFSLIRERDE